MSIVIGLYGCSCHPFESWQQHDFYNKKKYRVNDIVKDRCTNLLGFIIEKKEMGFYTINMFPFKFKSDIISNHVSNLIPYNELTEDEKNIINNAKILN